MVIVVINSHPLLVLTNLPHFHSRTWYVFCICVATVANFHPISVLEVNFVFFSILLFKPAHCIWTSWGSFTRCMFSYTTKSNPLWVKVCVPWTAIWGRQSRIGCIIWQFIHLVPINIEGQSTNILRSFPENKDGSALFWWLLKQREWILLIFS